MGQPGTRSSPGDSAQELGDLRALLAIAERGLSLRARAVEVLRLCAAPGEPPSTVAREGGYVAGEYYRLWGWSLDFAPNAGPESLERRVSVLLMQHCHLVHLAVRLAFPEYRTVRLEQRRQMLVDLGPIVTELLTAREELDMWISTLEPHTTEE